MEYFELWKVVCDSAGYCTDWLVLWNLTWDECQWEINHWYGEGNPYCVFSHWEE